MQQDPYSQDDIEGEEDTSSFSPSAMGSGQMDSESLRYILNSDNVLKDLSKDLEFLKANKDLRLQILFLVKPILSRTIYLSDLDEEHVYNISYNLNKSVIKAVFEKGDNLSNSEKSTIINLCFAIIFSSLRRPYKGGERKLLRETQQSKEILQRMAGKQQKGGWRTWFAKF